MKIAKNNVSYFLAGFEAGMREAGVKDIRDQMYRSTKYPSIAREYLRAYDSKDEDTEGLNTMHSLAENRNTKI